MAFIAIFLSVGQAQAFQQEKRKAPRQHLDSADFILNKNKVVREYTATDLKSVGKPGDMCPAGGHSPSREMCFEYNSFSTNTTWLVQYVKNGRAEAIFKMENGKSVPWLYFEPGGSPVYLSEAARQRFAGVGRQKSSGGVDTIVSSASAKDRPSVYSATCSGRDLVKYGAQNCPDRTQRKQHAPPSVVDIPSAGSLFGNVMDGVLRKAR